MQNIIDLEIAKNRLQNSDLTLVIVKNEELLFETKKRGIRGFLEAIEKIGSSIDGSSIADKVVGKAIALLCVYSKVASVFAKVISIEAKKLLEKHKTKLKWSVIVKEILNNKRNETCPFEMRAKNMIDPEKFYFELKNLIKMLKNCEENQK